MIGSVQTLTLFGVTSYEVTVEADIFSGLPHFGIVGLAETEVKEARERIRSAIRQSDCTFPMYRIVVNLAPAGLKKESNSFDVPMAIAILIASGQLKGGVLQDTYIVGELSLTGEVRPVKGIVSFVLHAQKFNKKLIIPRGNEKEVRKIGCDNYIPVSTLQELIAYCHFGIIPEKKSYAEEEMRADKIPCFSEIYGQDQAKRALEIAATGSHNVLLTGAPGTGKSLLSHAISGILPPLEQREVADVLQIYTTTAQNYSFALSGKRPFRQVHHTASHIAVVGGGKMLTPGEVTYAHHGVLFFDEVPEFRRETLEVLREPMEERKITLSRAHGTVTYPANFMFIGAQNPCPCGYYLDTIHTCTCSMTHIEKYQKKISGPLRDRIDIFCFVPRISFNELREQKQGETSESIRARVIEARTRFRKRCEKYNITASSHAHLTAQDIKKMGHISDQAQQTLYMISEKKQISLRSYTRLLKVSTSIADLEGSAYVEKHHVLEAFGFKDIL